MLEAEILGVEMAAREMLEDSNGFTAEERGIANTILRMAAEYRELADWYNNKCICQDSLHHFEEDENPADVLNAYEAGEKGKTAPPNG